MEESRQSCTHKNQARRVTSIWVGGSSYIWLWLHERPHGLTIELGACSTEAQKARPRGAEGARRPRQWTERNQVTEQRGLESPLEGVRLAEDATVTRTKCGHGGYVGWSVRQSGTMAVRGWCHRGGERGAWGRLSCEGCCSRATIRSPPMRPTANPEE